MRLLQLEPEEAVVLMDYHSRRLFQLNDYTGHHLERAKYWTDEVMEVRTSGQSGQDEIDLALKMARRP